MELMTEDLTRFVGGQIEVQDDRGKYLYRGEIASLLLEDNTLKVRLAWMAKANHFPPHGPKDWTRDHQETYEASLILYGVSVIGEGRICLNSCGQFGGHELTVLFPNGGSVLDPLGVLGLERLVAERAMPAAQAEVERLQAQLAEAEGKLAELRGVIEQSDQSA